MKKVIAATIAVGLSFAMTMTSWAGEWNHDDTGWWYVIHDKEYQQDGWFQDPADGQWYYASDTGYILQNTWMGNYYLGASGAMLTNATTPDGYKVGSDGAWIADVSPEVNEDTWTIDKTSDGRPTYRGDEGFEAVLCKKIDDRFGMERFHSHFTKGGIQDNLKIRLDDTWIRDYHNRYSTEFVTLFKTSSEKTITKAMDSYVEEINVNNNVYRSFSYGGYLVFVLFPEDEIDDFVEVIKSAIDYRW